MAGRGRIYGARPQWTYRSVDWGLDESSVGKHQHASRERVPRLKSNNTTCPSHMYISESNTVVPLLLRLLLLRTPTLIIPLILPLPTPILQLALILPLVLIVLINNLAIIIQLITLPIQPHKLRHPIPMEIHRPLIIKHMTRRLETLPPLLTHNLLDQPGEQQYHIPPLVHNRTPAVRAAHLTRQMVLHALRRRVVPPQVMVPMREADVLLVEDRRPLEGCAVQALTGGAVAVFRHEGRGAG